MPRPLLYSALLFGVSGLACLGGFVAWDFGSALPLWAGSLLLVTAVGLILGRPWGRGLASAMIFFGYLASAFYLLSATQPMDRKPWEIWQAYGLVFVAVAILTVVSGSLWSRSVSAHFNRFSRLAEAKKI